ncbi:MAG: VCBS repeat-containing protein [Caldilineae bacterium]|nr:VCBS repeat-containing protein [Caldilineae bacterium]
MRDQRLSGDQQGQWIGPAPAPFDLRDLPETGSLSPARAAYAATRAADVNASLTTLAAFRVVGDNIDDWTTDAAMVGDFDGDGKTDIAGWSDTAVADEPETQPAPAEQESASEAALSEDVAARQPATDTVPLENTLDNQPAEAPAAGWRIWHSDGYSTQLAFTEYSNNLPAAVTGSTARLLGDFDGDQKTDIGYWDGSQWQFVRSDGTSGSAFSFTPASSNLGSLASGNTGQMLTGDFDGDGKRPTSPPGTARSGRRTFLLLPGRPSTSPWSATTWVRCPAATPRG